LEEGPEEEEAEGEVDEVKAGVLKGSELDPHPQDQAHPGEEVEQAAQVHASLFFGSRENPVRNPLSR
jgi:hypothetical protein